MQRAHDLLDKFLAEWVLERVTPEQAVDLAVAVLGQGCAHQSVTVVAGSTATTHAEVEAELPRLIAAFDRELPSANQALKLLVDSCAAEIVHGGVDPVRGAWAMFDLWVNEHESLEVISQIRAFVDLVADDDTPYTEPERKRAAIRAEAKQFLGRGGLRLLL